MNDAVRQNHAISLTILLSWWQARGLNFGTVLYHRVYLRQSSLALSLSRVVVLDDRAVHPEDDHQRVCYLDHLIHSL